MFKKIASPILWGIARIDSTFLFAVQWVVRNLECTAKITRESILKRLFNINELMLLTSLVLFIFTEKMTSEGYLLFLAIFSLQALAQYKLNEKLQVTLKTEIYGKEIEQRRMLRMLNLLITCLATTRSLNTILFELHDLSTLRELVVVSYLTVLVASLVMSLLIEYSLCTEPKNFAME